MATTVAPRFGSADDFWREIDEAVVGCIASGETMPSEIGRGLGLSESAVCSIVAMLAIEG